MKRIERKYAIIYVDLTGKTLESDDYFTKEMISDYYKNPGFLQWNFYLIIARESVKDIDDIKIIEDNDTYARKYVVEKDKIDDFIDFNFPKIQSNYGNIKLILADTFEKAVKNAFTFLANNPNVASIPSYNRDVNFNHSLKKMDNLRRLLIKNPNMKVIFYTHIDNEYSLAKKKFELFL